MQDTNRFIVLFRIFETFIHKPESYELVLVLLEILMNHIIKTLTYKRWKYTRIFLDNSRQYTYVLG